MNGPVDTTWWAKLFPYCSTALRSTAARYGSARMLGKVMSGACSWTRIVIGSSSLTPDITFPNILAEPYLAAVDRKAVEQYGKSFAHHVVSTGPFTLTAYDSAAQTSTFKANPYY